MIEPLPLGRLDTPLEPLPAASARLGVEVWVKRDDLTGLGLSGNKVRKLRHLLAEARALGATCVITCGGIQSNHCRATAVAARIVGLRPVLLLRGTPPRVPDGNLLLDHVLGAEIHWTSPEGYRQRGERMAEIAARLTARGERPHVIPEGGSNARGALGFVDAGRELTAQCAARSLAFDTVVCAVGSGGTVAGLALADLAPRVLGVAVCDDRATFRRRVQEIGLAAERFGLRLPPPGERWEIIEGFVGRGYALSTPDELRGLATVARESGLLLDPVYTGKAWAGLEAMGAAGALGRRTLFWHTGGLFGLFGRGVEVAAALTDGG